MTPTPTSPTILPDLESRTRWVVRCCAQPLLSSSSMTSGAFFWKFHPIISMRRPSLRGCLISEVVFLPPPGIETTTGRERVILWVCHRLVWTPTGHVIVLTTAGGRPVPALAAHSRPEGPAVMEVALQATRLGSRVDRTRRRKVNRQTHFSSYLPFRHAAVRGGSGQRMCDPRSRRSAKYPLRRVLASSCPVRWPTGGLWRVPVLFRCGADSNMPLNVCPRLNGPGSQDASLI